MSKLTIFDLPALLTWAYLHDRPLYERALKKLRAGLGEALFQPNPTFELLRGVKDE